MPVLSLRRSLLTLAIANVLTVSVAAAKNITLTPPSGGDFRVR